MNRSVFPLIIFFALLLFNASSFASNNDQGASQVADQSISHNSEPQQFVGILESHNKVRQKLRQQPLTWSNSLASYAQQWVNRLAQPENCDMHHRPNYQGQPDSDKFLQIHGENLFWAGAETISNGSKKSQYFSPAEVVAAWAEEENYYDYQTNTCQPGQICGHFTQMVWHESQQVGCAKAVCGDKSQIWACNYHPRGNFIGEKPY